MFCYYSYKQHSWFTIRSRSCKRININVSLYIWWVPIYKFNRFDFGKHTKTNTLNESTIKNLPSKISHWKHTHWMNLNQKYQPKMPLKNTHIQKFFPLKNPIENESIIHPPIHHPFIHHQQNSSPSTPPPSNSPFHLVSHGTKIS